MRISCTDQSTGLLNRRGFDEGAASALSMADKANLTTTALMCDLDRFKSRRAALVRAGNRGPGGAPRWRGIRRVDGRVPHEPAAPAPARRSPGSLAGRLHCVTRTIRISKRSLIAGAVRSQMSASN
jgi:hypothetical protein